MTLALFGKLRKNHSLRTWSRMIEMPKRVFLKTYIRCSFFRLFWLFYFTACISTLFALIYVITDTSLQDVTITLNLLLYLTHVSRRLYECLYVSIFSDSSMNILHFFLGISFYPLCVCSQVVSFISGSITGMDNQLVSMKLLYAMLVVAVLLIQVQQHHCFVSLAALRLSAPMLLCFTFVVLNQTITAFWNRNWYQKHFRGSDTNRKALIPYIL
ncbi:unnamed protein product [Thelazia callipaeda]|uniref:Polyprenal reductase n=1 Tax=Thelazia callipaeda TaxID=103827 RepID=A0A0N5CMU2_THECL|nr:unnamed protein product [Thelazia callipaeda]